LHENHINLSEVKIVSRVTHDYIILNILYHAFYKFRLRNDLYCVEWGVKLYSLTHSRFTNEMRNDVNWHHSVRKTHTKWRSRWRNAWCEM